MKPRGSVLWVRTSSGRCPVWIGAGLLGYAGRYLKRLRPGRRWFAVSSPPVWSLWGSELQRGARSAGLQLDTLLMDDREEKKRLDTVERLAEELLRCGADRGATLLALGGGVVGDVAGFLAASYMRGVDYVQVPTTLVGQIDSAIGGKTGVNLRGGKNLLGAFHQPRAVLVDPGTLSTLPLREYRAGLYEVVKCGVIGDPALFRLLERHMSSVLAGDERALHTMLVRSVRLKARIVARDERERNLRRVLNFGHTFGHAFEALTNYRGLRHGEAVGWGMIAATRLAERLGRVSRETVERIITVVRSVGALPALPRLPADRVYAQLFADKKRREADLCFILPRRVGQVDMVSDVPRAAVLATLRRLASDQAL